MSGREEVISSDSYHGDTHDGIMTRAVTYLYGKVRQASRWLQQGQCSDSVSLAASSIMELLVACSPA